MRRPSLKFVSGPMRAQLVLCSALIGPDRLDSERLRYFNECCTDRLTGICDSIVPFATEKGGKRTVTSVHQFCALLIKSGNDSIRIINNFNVKSILIKVLLVCVSV